MSEATAEPRPQTRVGLRQATRTEFLADASRGGRLRNHDIRALGPPLVEEALRKGSVRGRDLPVELTKKTRELGAQFWVPQVIGFRVDGLPLGEAVRHLDGKEEIRMLVPCEFRKEAEVVVNGKSHPAAVIASEWDVKVREGAGEGGRTLVVLKPVDPHLVPFGQDYFRFEQKGDLLLPVEPVANGFRNEVSVNRIFIDGEYAGPFVRTRNLLGDVNWLFFGKTHKPTAAVIIESLDSDGTK
jgi:hypothetical protein